MPRTLLTPEPHPRPTLHQHTSFLLHQYARLAPSGSPAKLTPTPARAVGIVFGKITTEVPHHTVIASKEGYEIRTYSPQLIATYSTPSSALTSDNGFRALAGYCGIFTKAKQVDDGKKKSMAMTAPVLMEGMDNGVGGARNIASMSFFLPSEVKTVEEAPTPLDPNVVVSQLEERTMAVLTFSGNVDGEVFKTKTAELEAMMDKDGLERTGDAPILASYNPPFCVPALKTNEVAIAVVVPKEGATVTGTEGS
ncbi:hypothetical protein RQP46_003759 [Phenoliferia psychrophenolica]